MAKPFRHRWDIVTLLQDHKKGLTLDQIVKEFDQPTRASAQRRDLEFATYATIKLRGLIYSEINKLLKSGEIAREDDVYRVNFASDL